MAVKYSSEKVEYAEKLKQKMQYEITIMYTDQKWPN